MTEQQAKDLAFIVEKRGYLVVTDISPYKIGDIIHSFVSGRGPKVQHPLRVIAVTDYDDYAEQVKLFGVAPLPGTYFYRCITD